MKNMKQFGMSWVLSNEHPYIISLQLMSRMGSAKSAMKQVRMAAFDEKPEEKIKKEPSTKEKMQEKTQKEAGSKSLR